MIYKKIIFRTGVITNSNASRKLYNIKFFQDDCIRFNYNLRAIRFRKNNNNIDIS